jgi:hypothetical protein
VSGIDNLASPAREPTENPDPSMDTRAATAVASPPQQAGTQAWPGARARSNYWQAQHGLDTALPLAPEADNSPWATVDWQHTPVLGPILQMGEAFSNGFRAGQVPRAASPQATYRGAQAGDESYMPSFQETGPSLRDVVTGIPRGLADTARMATTPPPPMPEGAYLLDGGPVQGTADPQEWRAWVTEMERRADLAPGLAVGLLAPGATFAERGALGTAGGGLRRPPIASPVRDLGLNRPNVLENAKFAQPGYSGNFSAKGDFKGRPIDDVVADINNRLINPSNVKIHYVIRDGNPFIMNTRSSEALTRAGIPRSQWNGVNETGTRRFEGELNDRMQEHGFTSSGGFTTVFEEPEGYVRPSRARRPRRR